MASIYGVELKNKKTWKGMEGLGLQASVYIDGKRVGTVTDEARGGNMIYNFDTKELSTRADKYRTQVWNKQPENQKYKDLYDPAKSKYLSDFNDQFICELDYLGDKEKEYKKAVKNGYHHIVYFRIDERGATRTIMCRDGLFGDELTETIAKVMKCNENQVIIESVICSPDDCVIK